MKTLQRESVILRRSTAALPGYTETACHVCRAANRALLSCRGLLQNLPTTDCRVSHSTTWHKNSRWLNKKTEQKLATLLVLRLISHLALTTTFFFFFFFFGLCYVVSKCLRSYHVNIGVLMMMMMMMVPPPPTESNWLTAQPVRYMRSVVVSARLFVCFFVSVCVFVRFIVVRNVLAPPL